MEMFMPLLIIAVIYLIVVLGLQYIQTLIEKKLGESDRKEVKA
jgi:ABC-type amino acid transport system permease subunit